MYQSSPCSTRNQLPRLLVEKSLTGHAVEIGTHRGEYAAVILSEWSGLLTCIDPWENLPDFRDEARFLVGGGQARQKDYQICRNRLDPFRSRVQMMRTVSKEAVRGFADESLDFVYIDGNHKDTAKDLQMWWPKVKPNAVIAGHDWMCPGHTKDDNWARYVQPAVHVFAQERELDVYLIVEENTQPWSWYLFKEVW